jgi:hypothetical protein
MITNLIYDYIIINRNFTLIKIIKLQVQEVWIVIVKKTIIKKQLP